MRVVISGCSGGGKSTLIEALSHQGYQTITEAGRRVVRDQLARGGEGLPWKNSHVFAQQCLVLGKHDYNTSHSDKITFFDRSIIDIAAYLDRLDSSNHLIELVANYPYHNKVFLVPPWRDIFTHDDARRHSYEDAIAEYEDLHRAYGVLGYSNIIIPRTTVAERVRFVLGYICAPAQTDVLS